MSRFACIGQSCEDHCCHGWQVHVDRTQFAKIRKAMRGDPAELRHFDASIELLPATDRRRTNFARLKLLPDATCPLLDGDRLCSLQRRHGAAILPDICSTFPRFMVDARTRIELSGALGCPEATRLALLTPDATDIVEMDPAAAAGMGDPTPVDPRLTRGGFQHLDEVRKCMHGLLGQTAFPLRSRLYFSLELLNQLRPVGPESDAAARILEAWEDPELLANLNDHFQRQLPLLALDLNPVLAAVTLFQKKVPHSLFTSLSLGILRSYLPPTEQRSNEESQVALSEVIPAYQRRRETILAALEERVDLYLQNYGRHLWIKEWFGQMAGLDAYIRSLLLRLTVLRFLLLSHPLAVAAATDPAQGAAALDRVAVQLVYSFSRAVEANAEMPPSLQHIANEMLSAPGASIGQLAT